MCSEEEWEDGVRHGVYPVRVHNFVQVTVRSYNGRQFREHFRMDRDTFEVSVISNHSILIIFDK